MNSMKKGFTLIELLVVVLIIGILASVAIPQYFKVVEKSRVAEATSMISTIRAAEERFMAKSGSYTNDPTQLDVDFQNAAVAGITGKFFTIAIAGAPAAYTITCTRSGAVPTKYGAYTITAIASGAPTIGACPGSDVATCTKDLL